MRAKILPALLASSLVMGAVAPVAFARDHDRGGYGWHDDGYRDDYRHHRRHRDDDHGDAVAAGVVGLIVGLALGAAASSDNDHGQAQCYDNYQRCDGPNGYYGDEGLAGGPDDGYGPSDSYYGPPPESADGRGGCISQREEWDPRAQRYVIVNVRRPCGE